MDRKDLKALKLTSGRQLANCVFSAIKKKLPKPLDKLSGTRYKSTQMLDVGASMRAVFIWKTGVVREQRSLYGWLFREVERGLEPVGRLDYHPSHKNLHVVLNCERELDLTNRGLPGCKEFRLHNVNLDPDETNDRNRFVSIFCERFGIRLGEGELL